PYNFSISKENVIGINSDTTYLGFGKVPRGGSSERRITISCPERCFVSIKIRGEKSDLISVDKNNFVLESNTPINISFEVSVPFSEEEGGPFNGTITFVFFRMP
ncbi:hypothetical protein J7K74_01255, partial [Candidatus Woesearchaeota archaeon]|nr:hypothetical protein [Candidatus Woesearchaeota archaeon]